MKHHLQFHHWVHQADSWGQKTLFASVGSGSWMRKERARRQHTDGSCQTGCSTEIHWFNINRSVRANPAQKRTCKDTFSESSVKQCLHCQPDTRPTFGDERWLACWLSKFVLRKWQFVVNHSAQVFKGLDCFYSLFVTVLTEPGTICMKSIHSTQERIQRPF